MDNADLDYIVKKLNEAKAISEWHFRDAVEEIMEKYAGFRSNTFHGDDA